MKNHHKCLSLIYILLSVTITLYAQADAPLADSIRKGAVRVFIDCRNCDMSYTRQEIPWVNYVRDVNEAQVYVLVTTQQTGSGGYQYTYTFQGLDNLHGMVDTLSYTSTPEDTSFETREKVTNLLKVGLIRYAAKTPIISEIEINHNEKIEETEIADNWNNWVFEISTSPRFNSEESYKRFRIFNSFNMSRVTPDVKIEIDAEHSFDKQLFIDNEDVTTYIRGSKRLDNLYVKSLGNHWSAGLRWSISSSTTQNYDFDNKIMPSVEYDLLPYSKATHRQLRVLYSIGYQYSDYIDTTQYFRLYEHLFLQQLRIAYQIQKKWGSVNISAINSTYLHDMAMSSFELYGTMRVRIIKGLTLSVNGSAAYINDQLSIRKGDLSEADILLRLKEQATTYSLAGGVGISYTFGSIYNNVVNPRFGNGNYNFD